MRVKAVADESTHEPSDEPNGFELAARAHARAQLLDWDDLSTDHADRIVASFSRMWHGAKAEYFAAAADMAGVDAGEAVAQMLTIM
ncbi:hypothetical protein LCGC14_2638970, partial [marine sediment metagenome]